MTTACERIATSEVWGFVRVALLWRVSVRLTSGQRAVAKPYSNVICLTGKLQRSHTLNAVIWKGNDVLTDKAPNEALAQDSRKEKGVATPMQLEGPNHQRKTQAPKSVIVMRASEATTSSTCHFSSGVFRHLSSRHDEVSSRPRPCSPSPIARSCLRCVMTSFVQQPLHPSSENASWNPALCRGVLNRLMGGRGLSRRSVSVILV